MQFKEAGSQSVVEDGDLINLPAVGLLLQNESTSLPSSRTLSTQLCSGGVWGECTLLLHPPISRPLNRCLAVLSEHALTLTHCAYGSLCSVILEQGFQKSNYEVLE